MARETLASLTMIFFVWAMVASMAAISLWSIHDEPLRHARSAIAALQQDYADQTARHESIMEGHRDEERFLQAEVDGLENEVESLKQRIKKLEARCNTE